jgi:hypothetical protein
MAPKFTLNLTVPESRLILYETKSEAAPTSTLMSTSLPSGSSPTAVSVATPVLGMVMSRSPGKNVNLGASSQNSLLTNLILKGLLKAYPTSFPATTLYPRSLTLTEVSLKTQSSVSTETIVLPFKSVFSSAVNSVFWLLSVTNSSLG